jgi:biotin carboxyl carrier protein
MQWSVTVDQKEIKLYLPQMIPDDRVFEAKFEEKSIKLRWQHSTSTFFILETADNGKVFERPFPIRSMNSLKDLDTFKHTISTEFANGSADSFHSTVGRYVFGQENRDKASQAKGATIRSPITGKVLKVFKNNGDEVQTGDVLLIIEAMKMENKILATAAGSLSNLNVNEGDQVSVNALLVKIN